ncbi:peptide ligase PGM1-related protein [Paenibacillus sp. P25]|nr:peptide ligase PGM1-related protein [Paenibacillus sp. P25]
MLCRKQDVLILRERPDAAYLKRLTELGFEIPTILTPKFADHHTPIAELVLQDDAPLGRLRTLAEESDALPVVFLPYAVTELEETIARHCGLSLIGPPSWLVAKVNDKIFNKRIAEELGFPTCQGVECETLEESRGCFDRVKGSGNRVILKEPYAASGKGLYIIDNEQSFDALLTGLSRVSRRRPAHPWILEQWMEKKADINYQIWISPDGKVDVFSIKRQILNGTVYTGSQMPAELEPEIIEAYRSYGEAIGRYLHGLGYSGVAGIDSIITADDVIIPLIEVNGRFTLSTYVSFIQHVVGDKKICSRYYRILTHDPVDFTALSRSLEKEELQYEPHTGEGILLYTAGSLPVVSVSEEGRYMGRVFVLVIADEWSKTDELASRLEKALQALSTGRREQPRGHESII